MVIRCCAKSRKDVQLVGTIDTGSENMEDVGTFAPNGGPTPIATTPKCLPIGSIACVLTSDKMKYSALCRTYGRDLMPSEIRSDVLHSNLRPKRQRTSQTCFLSSGVWSAARSTRARASPGRWLRGGSTSEVGRGGADPAEASVWCGVSGFEDSEGPNQRDNAQRSGARLG